jgi:hypothetical protein
LPSAQEALRACALASPTPYARGTPSQSPKCLPNSRQTQTRHPGSRSCCPNRMPSCAATVTRR